MPTKRRICHSCLALCVYSCSSSGTDTTITTPAQLADVPALDLPPPPGGLPQPYGTACRLDGTPDAPAAMTTENAFPALSFDRPVHVTNAGDGTDRVFVVEKPGRVKVFPNDPSVAASQVKVLLDITDRVESAPSEAGLLSVAFHPEFEKNRRFFVNYTGKPGGKLTTFVSEFTVDAGDPAHAAAASEKKLLTIVQPAENHNGGQIAFGPDGMLYVGMGDGGGGGDTFGNGRNKGSLHAKMLRIDIDDVPAGKSYGIPTDNPFVDDPEFRPEIFAWGLRNPWRFSFDRLTGQLWAGDVGQDQWEEVNVIEAGKDYGWNIMEGAHCFKPKTGCDQAGLTLPVAEYEHSAGKSITGGFVYRGARHAALFGAYVYADYAYGTIASAHYEQGAEPVVTELAKTAFNISSFGEDEAGELFVVNFPFATPTNGSLHRLVPSAAAPALSTFPLTLTATGCFANVASMTPAEGLIPYDVNSSLWHDGARSQRFLVLPPFGKMTPPTTGAWTLPDGTKLIKTFVYDRADGSEVLLETRFLVRTGESWRFYTYRWNEEQTDAVLISGASERSFDLDGEARTWHFPSRAQCASCHNKSAGDVLGWHTGQLNKDFAYDGSPRNQLEAFAELGILDEEIVDPPVYPNPADDSASLDSRARSALFANCASCHRPDSPTTTQLDLRFETPLKDTRTCDVTPDKGDLGVAGAKIVAPGNPESSTLWLRMKTLDESRMPDIGTSVVDEATAALVASWIQSLAGCDP